MVVCEMHPVIRVRSAPAGHTTLLSDGRVQQVSCAMKGSWLAGYASQLACRCNPTDPTDPAAHLVDERCSSSAIAKKQEAR